MNELIGFYIVKQNLKLNNNDNNKKTTRLYQKFFARFL